MLDAWVGGAGWGSAPSRPSRRRLVAGGLLFTALIAATSGGGADAASLLDMLFPTTTRATTSTSSTTTSSTTTTAPPPVDGSLTLRDTTYTRLRVTVDNNAAWVSFTLDGTEIKASKIIEQSGNARITSTGPTIAVNGVGRAVLDFVLRIPASNPTGVTMCKNYMGPTTVTLTRLTDAPAVAATITNSGSNGYPPKGQCENLMHRDVSRSDLIGPVRWPARREHRAARTRPLLPVVRRRFRPVAVLRP